MELRGRTGPGERRLVTRGPDQERDVLLPEDRTRRETSCYQRTGPGERRLVTRGPDQERDVLLPEDRTRRETSCYQRTGPGERRLVTRGPDQERDVLLPEDRTRRERYRYEGVVHLQRLQEDGPKPGLHHPKGTLYNGACPGMMAIEALGSHTSNGPLVGSDEGEGLLEARVPAICKYKVPWRRVDRLLVQWAVPEYPSVMH
ncbi:hypothetical protein NHX12_021998 [Muraenolepis orangiensis]|uniref:Uncharacterized protein n=1 Tax=Muraenolepis orangiensis TaxID=630683 RepID=A0A9Q0EMB7_9TELE|nr:hypothetical protein NHX12_021998 [Muraenolepis orangiensis]